MLTDYLNSEGFFGQTFQQNQDQGEGDMMDEQLQMVLRISLEEERKRLEELEKQRFNIGGGAIKKEKAEEGGDKKEKVFILRVKSVSIRMLCTMAIGE